MSDLKVLATVRPKSLVIAAAVINSANAIGLEKDMVITAGTDGQHRRGSKHYTGEALDIRTKTLTRAERVGFIAHLKRKLGANYDVVLEDVGRANELLHVERDPP
jgi:hypothetical protein